jgi:hypothetical protein
VLLQLCVRIKPNPTSIWTTKQPGWERAKRPHERWLTGTIPRLDWNAHVLILHRNK